MNDKDIFDIESMIQELDKKNKEINIHKIEPEELEIKIESIEPEESKEPEEHKEPEEPEEKKTETQKEPKEFDMKEFETKMMILERIINMARGGVSIESRVKPVLNPENWKTSSFMTRGEINMIWSFMTLAEISPEECTPLINASINYALLNLSKEGFGLERAIEMGKALTEISTTKSYSEKEPTKPTEGMKA